MRSVVCMCAIYVGAMFLFTSCSFMPEEEVLPASPILYSYEAEEYNMTAVMRGDIVISKTVNCTYVSAKEEDLSFSTGGKYIDKIHVREGDQVKAGQVLAELELDNLQEQVASEKYQLKVLNLKKEHIEELKNLDLAKYDIVLNDLQWEIDREKGYRIHSLNEKKEELQKERLEMEESYAQQMQATEDAVYLQKIRIKECEQDLKARQIMAGIDGTVTYVRKVTAGQKSVKGETMITVSDLDTTVFKVEGEDTQYFSEGTDAVISCQNKELIASVVSDEIFGQKNDKEDEPVIYLQLKQPDPTLKEGARGKITVILEESRDTLYVIKSAVGTVDGEAFVYTVDEDGLLIMQKVKTGLEDGKYIEIIDGLKENDSIIIK